MPGKGMLIARAYTADESMALGESIALLGADTYDVYLNPTTCWRNVPRAVWDYTIGGYQVIKKWLSYREGTLLKRALTDNDMREVMLMARRIAALLLLTLRLDANYEVVVADVYAWTPNLAIAVPTSP